MAVLDVLLAHGSRNQLFLVDGDETAIFASDAEMREFIRRMNDPHGLFGGGDGLHFIQNDEPVPSVTYYNADGSDSSMCGNGMRCVMRLIMERRGVDELTVRIGTNHFTGRSAPELAPGVPAVALSFPPVTYEAARVPIHSGLDPHVDAVLPDLHPTMRFTALAVPNPHLVTFVDAYDEGLLVELGARVAAGVASLPAGINISFVQPLADDDLLVRTYERGSALTPACGSANVASRTVYSLLGYVAPDRRVRLRNAGGTAVSWLEGDGDTRTPYLEGNATYEFRTSVDSDLLVAGTHPAPVLDRFDDEEAAYAEVAEANLAHLAAAGIRV